jgi:hypothetical protein
VNFYPALIDIDGPHTLLSSWMETVGGHNGRACLVSRDIEEVSKVFGESPKSVLD